MEHIFTIPLFGITNINSLFYKLKQTLDSLTKGLELFQQYFSVKEPYFSLITNQHKPNFSETNRAYISGFRKNTNDNFVVIICLV